MSKKTKCNGYPTVFKLLQHFPPIFDSQFPSIKGRYSDVKSKKTNTTLTCHLHMMPEWVKPRELDCNTPGQCGERLQTEGRCRGPECWRGWGGSTQPSKTASLQSSSLTGRPSAVLQDKCSSTFHSFFYRSSLIFMAAFVRSICHSFILLW